MTRYLAPIALCIAGLALLLSLGTWQVRRLEWKQGILAEIEARIAAEPVALPAALDRERDRYLPVMVAGTFTGERLRVLTSLPGVGPGALLVEAFETEGRRILVDQGYRPDTAGPATTGVEPGQVSGNVHWPDEVRSGTPEPDGDLWFARDVDAMAAALNTEPVMVIARDVTRPTRLATPQPVDTRAIPNDHLQYAITWFGLAAVWLGMTLYWVSRIRRAQG